MKLTPQDVNSLKDTSNWNGFTYEGEAKEGMGGMMADAGDQEF